MNRTQIRKTCLSLAGTTEETLWKKDLVFKVGGKMFACYDDSEQSTGRFSFKVDDERFLELTDQPGILPAPYLARAHWVLVDPKKAPLDKTELGDLLRRSYELVFKKLTKKKQKEMTGN